MLGNEVTARVLDDWRSAPLRPALRATLGFLEKLTLQPESVGAEDAAAVIAAGVSAEALEDAIRVCTLFNMINRVADALEFRPLDRQAARRTAMFLGRIGYRI